MRSLLSVSIFGVLFMSSGAVVAQTTTPSPAPTGAATPTASAPDPLKAMFDKADANHDGVLTLEEWKAAGRQEQGFRMIDADNDGKVTVADIKTAMSKRNGG